MSNTTQKSGSKLIRIPASQSAPYTSSSSRVNVIVPNNLIIDMDKSYLEVQLLITTDDKEIATGEGVYNFEIFQGTNDEAQYNVGLIKNCRLSSDQKGILEETQDVNILRNTLNEMNLTYNEKFDLQVNSLRQTYDRFAQKYNIFADYNGLGTSKSGYRLGRVPIKMSQLFGLGNVELNTSKVGALDIQVELNIAGIEASVIDNSLDEININDLTAGSDVVVISEPTNNMSTVPFWVGQKVDVLSSGTSVKIGLITEISRDDEGNVSIRVNGLSPTGGEATCTIKPYIPTGQDLNIEWAGLSMVCYVLDEESIDTSGGINYLSYVTERFNNANADFYNNTFNCPPECVNAMMCFNDDGNGYSIADLENYRLVLDNINLTDRPVDYKSPLYYDSLVRFCLNEGSRFMNTMKITKSADADLISSNTGGKDTAVVCTPLPMTAQNKLLEFNLELNSAFSKGIVFKQLSKNI